MVKQVLEAGSLEGRVWEALSGVHDPEIPPCSITDLGIVEQVRVFEEAVEVELLPTFAGCPALDVIRADAEAAVRSVADDRDVTVRFVYSRPWTSDRISGKGRDALQAYGVTPPEQGAPAATAVPLLQKTEVECPFCGSRRTVMESAFGPTLCRSIHFCSSCRNPFEAFKPKMAP